MRSLETSKALALVAAITKGNGGVHFEAHLGLGSCPVPTEFDCDDTGALQRCIDWLDYVGDATDTLRVHVLETVIRREAEVEEVQTELGVDNDSGELKQRSLEEISKKERFAELRSYLEGKVPTKALASASSPKEPRSRRKGAAS